MVKIRLALQGSKKQPFYKIVVADSRSPRNGKFIEQIGFFNPTTKHPIQSMNLNTIRMTYWIKNGAITSKKTKKIINKIIRDSK